MSKGQRICVCGKERGKEPVVITITTCRHKHETKVDRGLVCISPPLATSSPIDVKADSKSNKSNGKSQEITQSGGSEAKKDATEDSSKPDEIGDISSIPASERTNGILESPVVLSRQSSQSGLSEAQPNEIQQSNEIQDTTTSEQTGYETANETAYESAQEDLSTTSPGFNTATESGIAMDETIYEETSSGVTDSQVNETSESQGNDTSVLSENDQENDTGQSSEVEEADSSDVANDPTVMMLTNIAVNTLPFLDNLFWYENTPESARKKSEGQLNKDNCSKELYIFERHSRNCRYNRKFFKKDNSFFDGGSVYESIGRLTFPTCNDDVQADDRISPSMGPHLKGDSRADSERNDNYGQIFKTLENYMKNKQFYEADLYKKGVGPLNLNLDKYISLGKMTKSSSKCNLEELYKMRKLTEDRAVQYEAIYGSNVRTSKWYDGFKMCFGMKNTEEFYDATRLKNHVMPRNESSYLVTKYLKI